VTYVSGGRSSSLRPPAALLWRAKSKHAKALLRGSQKRTGPVKDVQVVEHPVAVMAETLYEAVAFAVAALQKDD